MKNTPRFGAVARWSAAVATEVTHAWESSWVPRRVPAPHAANAPAWRLRLDPWRLAARARDALATVVLRRPPALYRAPANGSAPAQPAALRVAHLVDSMGLGGTERVIFDLVGGLAPEAASAIFTGGVRYFAAYRNLDLHVIPDPAAAARAVCAFTPSIVHVHHFGLTGWLQPVVEQVVRRSPGVRVIVNENNPIPAWRHPSIRRHVFVSEHQRALQPAPLSGPSSVIYPGVNLDEFRANRPPRPADTIGLVYRLNDDKLGPLAIEPLIDVVKRRPHTLVIVVEHGIHFARFVARTRAERVRDRFEFAGRVPYATLPAWYDRFSVFCAPVREESFGLVVPYAMAKGVPVAGFRAGAVPELVGDGTLLASSRDELVYIMISLLDDRARAERAAAAGRSRAEELFGIARTLRAYRDLYRSLTIPSGDAVT